MRKQSVVILILSILLLACLIFIGYGYYSANKLAEQQNIVNQGIQFGYEQAVLQVMEQASTCQPVPLTYNNQTINVIAVECLQQSQ